MRNIVEVDFKDIEMLTDVQLTDLLCRLLYLEANSSGIPSSCVSGSLKINVADEGEDAHIKWEGEPESTSWIPNKFTLFQCKATDMYPSNCKDEILKNHTKDLKSRVEKVFDSEGSYILFLSRACNEKQKEDRIKKFREGIKEAGKDYSEEANIKIYDANQIARWTNEYLSTIIIVQKWLGKILPSGLETWEQWAGYFKNKFDYVLNDTLESHIKQLRDHFTEPRQVARIVGLSGLGKTRLALETFRPPKNSESNLKQKVRSNKVVYLDEPNDCPNLLNTIKRWRNEGRVGIIIIDNCKLQKHKKLKKIVQHPDSYLSLLTIDYSFAQTSDYDPYIELEPLPDKTIEKILKQKYPGLLDPDISRIVEFSQGFPKMAALLAEARLNEESNIGNLEDDILANKLLWGRDDENRNYYDVISTCSLFEYFGIEDDAVKQRKFIAEHICNIDNDLFYEGIQYFLEKGILEKRGRFARVTPKPLAIRLAANWWKKCSPEKAKRILTKDMPKGMHESFCDQMAKLDFLPKAKNLVDELCGEQAPFGQAEVLNTEKGSRLFRSLVEVDPKATAKALRNAFGNWTKEELLEVGPGRRNLIWALEKLCFWEETFPIASRMMLKFAAAENESWGNNATNQFLQLFNTFLSGTQAPPELRFEVIDEALSKNDEYKILAIKALGRVIQTRHFSRMGGVESQGSRAPKKDWEPEVWEDAFSYWRKGLEYLTDIACEKGKAQMKELAREKIVDNIRGLVSYGLMDEVEMALNKISKNKNIFWLEAYKQVQEAIKYEGDKIPKQGKKQLEKWLNILEPKSIKGRLKLAVSQPPWFNKENEDTLQININKLAKECVNNLSSLISNLEIIFTGEQRNGYKFGFALAKEFNNPQFFIDEAILTIKSIPNDKVNVSVLGGFLAAIREEFSDLVTNTLKKVSEDEEIYMHSVNLIRLSNPTLEELEFLIDMVKNNKIDINKLEVFSYGRVLDSKSPKDIIDFIKKLNSINKQAVPIGFEIIYMYCYENEEKFKKCKNQIRDILLTPGLLSEEEISSNLDYYNWKQSIKLFLENESGDDELARHIGKEIIRRCNNPSISNVAEERYNIKPIISILLKEYKEKVWPIFGNALLSDNEVLKFKLRNLLNSSNRDEEYNFKITSVLGREFLIEWCNNYPNKAPIELAKIVNLTEEYEDGYLWTPISKFLIDNYGEKDKVLSAIYSNLRTITWTGSLVPYLEKIKSVITKLLNHDNTNVCNWAREISNNLKKEIKKEKKRDEEEGIGTYKV